MKTKWILPTFLLLAGSFLVAGDQQRVRGGMNMVENLDTNGDGQISKEEYMARTDERFQAMDVNGDGVLTEDEIPTGRRHRREASGKSGQRMGRRGPGHLIMVADADQSQDVTAAEWSAFIDAITAEDGLNVDPEKLMSLLPERTGRGMGDRARPEIALADLQACFARMDENSDGMLSEDEFPKMRTRRGAHRAFGGMLLLKVAESDGEPGISSEEWSAFLNGLDADAAGVLDVEALAVRISEACDIDANNERRPPFDRILDMDRDGSVEIEDLEAVFARLDRDGNGAISEEEMSPPRRRRGKM